MKKIHLQTEIEVYTYSELTAIQQTLVDKAKEATSLSYSPYSKFSVGVAILLENGEIICGTNQENVAYPSGICAERTAMFYANSTYPHVAPICIAIAAFHNGTFTQSPITPCGACRQVLLESEVRYEKPISILLYGEAEIVLVKHVHDLLPLNFAPSRLLSS
jgi:cytidine deaminase